VIVEEFGLPMLGFSIYNPDKKNIEDFGKMELQVNANAMFLTPGLRQTLILAVTITRIDVVIWNVITSEIVSLLRFVNCSTNRIRYFAQ